MHRRCAQRLCRTGLVVLTVLVTQACGSDPSPTSPSTSPAPTPSAAPQAVASLASLSASPTTVGGAGTAAVTVTLAAAVPSDTTVSLSSSNAAVAVPATVVVPGGQTNVVVNVTTSAVATTTTAQITATLGSASQTAQITVQAGALQGLAFDTTSVLSQGSSVGTVTLSASAPPGGATVTLESRNTDALKVPPTVFVPQGALRATFIADATTIRFSTAVTVNATYAGVTTSATLIVRPPELVADFKVTSESRGSDVCVMVIAGAGIRMDCALDARASRGFPTRYQWTMRNGDKSTTWTSTEPSSRPPADCSVLSGGRLSGGALGITLSLVLSNDEGASSALNSRGVQFIPAGQCGY